MKKIKFSFESLDNILSKDQMRQVVGGYNGVSCKTGACSVYFTTTGSNVSGTCGVFVSGGPVSGIEMECRCSAWDGPLSSNGGVSYCRA